MQAVIIFHDVVGKIGKYLLCNVTDRFERDDSVQCPMDDDR